MLGKNIKKKYDNSHNSKRISESWNKSKDKRQCNLRSSGSNRIVPEAIIIKQPSTPLMNYTRNLHDRPLPGLVTHRRLIDG